MNKHNYFYYFKSIHFVYDKIFNPLGILTQVSKLREGFFYAIKKLTIFQINLYIKFEIVRTDSSMEQVMGIEPTSQPWQGHVLAVVLHLHKYAFFIKSIFIITHLFNIFKNF